MSRLGEYVLGRLSHSVQEVAEWEEPKPADPLETTRELWPGFLDKIDGQRVLDYGCGLGHEARAMAEHADEVVGFDTNPRVLAKAKALTDGHPEAACLHFLGSAEDLEGRFDLVFSQNSMEHFPRPIRELRRMGRLVGPHGRIFLHFATPWLSPYGSHMHFFCPLPWVHVLFSEKTVMKVREQFRDDGAKRYEEVEGGLNRMTLAKFHHCVREAKLRIRSRTLVAVKRLPLVTRVPVVREFLTNRVACVLEPLEAAGGGG